MIITLFYNHGLHFKVVIDVCNNPSIQWRITAKAKQWCWLVTCYWASSSGSSHFSTRVTWLGTCPFDSGESRLCHCRVTLVPKTSKLVEQLHSSLTEAAEELSLECAPLHNTNIIYSPLTSAASRCYNRWQTTACESLVWRLRKYC